MSGASHPSPLAGEGPGERGKAASGKRQAASTCNQPPARQNTQPYNNSLRKSAGDLGDSSPGATSSTV